MFLKNKNLIFKIRRSKVTDYAALKNIESTNARLNMNLQSLVILNLSGHV